MSRMQGEILFQAFMKRAALKRDISDFVRKGGRIAFDFSAAHFPKYKEIPGIRIQRMIDEEYENRRRYL